MFLEISENSQENTCARVSFLIKLQASPFLTEYLLGLLLIFTKSVKPYVFKESHDIEITGFGMTKKLENFPWPFTFDKSGKNLIRIKPVKPTNQHLPYKPIQNGQCNCIEFQSFAGKHFRISNSPKNKRTNIWNNFYFVTYIKLKQPIQWLRKKTLDIHNFDVSLIRLHNLVQT